MIPTTSFEQAYTITQEALGKLTLELRQAQSDNQKLREALKEIAKGSGCFSVDPHQFAKNVIQNVKDIAKAALAETKEEK